MVVAARDQAADNVVVLTLTSVGDFDLPSWTPGAHIDLLLENGLTRQYSLCGDPGDKQRYRVAVLLEPQGGGGSKYIHENLIPGVCLSIRGPRNHFQLISAERYVFIAGGIGITPILPMVKEAEVSGKAWNLHYAGRRTSTMAFLDELAVYGDRVSISAKEDGRGLDLASVLSKPDTRTVVYCCGPERLNDAASTISEASWPVGSMRVERFIAKASDDTANAAFTIRLERSGLTLKVPPDKSTMQVMEEAGVHVPCSCAVGTCGTCETYVLEGAPEHRDSVLTAEERADNTSMMVCVSRSKTPLLVLDA